MLQEYAIKAKKNKILVKDKLMIFWCLTNLLEHSLSENTVYLYEFSCLLWYCNAAIFSWLPPVNAVMCYYVCVLRGKQDHKKFLFEEVFNVF